MKVTLPAAAMPTRHRLPTAACDGSLKTRSIVRNSHKPAACDRRRRPEAHHPPEGFLSRSTKGMTKIPRWRGRVKPPYAVRRHPRRGRVRRSGAIIPDATRCFRLHAAWPRQLRFRGAAWHTTCAAAAGRGGATAHRHPAGKEDGGQRLRMEKEQVPSLILMMKVPAQIPATGRRVVYRLLAWNAWQHVFFRLLDQLRQPLRC
jgi:hypothetical protein